MFFRHLQMFSNVADDAKLDWENEPCQQFQDIHIVFSTSCSPFQNWQSYAFFYHAMRVEQPGNVTRIVSGCTDEQQQIYARRHEEEVVLKMSNRFHIHFTPDYTNTVIPGQSYMYFNKPFGLRHWMKHVLGYPKEPTKTMPDDNIIALLDPDMILTRPLVNNFEGATKLFWYHGDEPGLARTCATHGKPIAQQYGFGNDWITAVGYHMVDIVGKDSPALNISKDDGPFMYSAGPPYLLTAPDMYKVVNLWCDLTPKIHPHYPHLLAEMYGYAMAVAHLQLPHQLVFQMMISEPLVSQEGWEFLNGVAPNQVCGREHVTNAPTVIHYCQYYSVGKYVVLKYYMDENFLSCQAQLLRYPPKDLAMRYNRRRHVNGSMVPFDDPQQAVRTTFMLCAVTEALNEAASYFKQHHCGDNGNFDASYTPFPVD
jgi:hypothetical protein